MVANTGFLLTIILFWGATGAHSTRRLLPGGGIGKGINSFQVHAPDRLIATQSTVTQIEAKAAGSETEEPVQAEPYSIFGQHSDNLPRRKLTAVGMDVSDALGRFRRSTAQRPQTARRLFQGADLGSREVVDALERSKRTAALSTMISEAARGSRRTDSATLNARSAWEETVGPDQDRAERRAIGRLLL